MHRKPEPVGGGKREFALLELGMYAGEYRPRFFGCCGESDVSDTLSERFGLDRGRYAVGDLRDGREFPGGNAVDPCLVASALELERVPR